MDRTTKQTHEPEVSGLESTQEALRHDDDFRGVVEPIHDHEAANDHFALIYENREDQFATAIPFVRQGLERGERVQYIADENSREVVLEAMNAHGIDVDSALKSGALSIHTKHDIYLRGGTFDREGVLEFLHDTIDDATEEYEALRVVGEMTWALGDEPDTEALIEYESLSNNVFDSRDFIGLCQYNRNRFPSEVIREIISTHPHLISDHDIFQNNYYIPPEEFLGPENPDQEIDQIMGSLRKQTEARSELQEHKRYLREFSELTENNDLPFEETVEKLLELGCDYFNLKGGSLSYLPSWDDDFRTEVMVGPEMPDETGVLEIQPGEDCFCRQAITQTELTAVPDTVGEEWDSDPVFQELGVRTYFGLRVTTDGDPYGTLWFYDTSPRKESFTDDERTFLELMGKWVSNELERTERDRAQRALYEITSARDLTLEDKIGKLLDIGCDRFGLDMGFLLKEEGEKFRVIRTHGTDLEEGSTMFSPKPDQYCNKTISLDVPVGVEDAEANGWDGDPLYQEYGLGCYLGTRVTDSNGVFGSVCFADSSARERKFTDDEYTFLDLMSQWLSYELEREHREEQLTGLNEISRDLMNTETWADIAQKVIDRSESAFDLPVTAIMQYDESGCLSLATQTSDAETALPSEILGESQEGAVWEAFVTNEMQIIEGGTEHDSLNKIVIVPLRNQGVLLTATTGSSEFAESEVEFIKTMTATVEAAFTRADRERELDEQNAELHRLSQINAIIRGIGQTLVQAETRAEIDRAVCDQFADSDLFEFAWIGEHDAGTDTITPSEWAGVEPDYLDSLTITSNDAPTGQGPIGTAVKTRDVQVVDDIILDSQFDPWRDQTLEQGVRACSAVPLTYEDSLYGVLAVYADHQQSRERDIELLEELGETIAYSINTVESTETRQTDSVVELTLQISEPGTTLATLAQNVGTQISFEGLVPAEDDSAHVFLTVNGASAEAVDTVANDRAAIEEVEQITESDDSLLLRATVSGSTLVPTLTGQGVAIHTLTFDGDRATAVVDLPSSTDVRPFLESLRDTYPAVELTSRRSCNRPLKSVRDIQTAIKEPLTDRQTEVLKMAYLSGFFESPRLSTGQDIADSLGISPPTFTQHLRAGQRKVFSLAFDEE
ncbi:MEDS domain-containing protein [Natronosalvus caseinilyticus]|uniref:MEDS domain-containing protein n=1 Tax=Natronosalvus caseinilyticus TaxID=2953747 RepID=UPI0028B152D8|nr:MEDS domain-containing protein [Natronosalvus caseinilyticus]